MRNILILFILLTQFLYAKNITNYTQLPKEKTSEEIFYKVCLDGVVYWVLSSKNPETTKDGRGGLALYYDKKTLQPKRCILTKNKCFNVKAKLGKNISKVCFKNFKIIK
jgi:hypothetical protein